MNSLSILSSQVERVIGTTPPASPRSESSFKRNNLNRSSISLATSVPDTNQSKTGESGQTESEKSDDATSPQGDSNRDHEQGDAEDDVDEVTTPLLTKENKLEEQNNVVHQSIYHIRLERLSCALQAPFKWLWSSIIFSTNYLTSCFYNDEKRFSPLLPLHLVFNTLLRPLGFRDSSALNTSYNITEESQVFSIDDDIEKTLNEDDYSFSKSRPILLSQYSQSKATLKQNDSNSFTTQPRLALPSEEDTAPRRSVRIRLFNQENLQQKSRSIKSPTSPSSSLRLTRYPKNVGPPRPLLTKNLSQKTLILDLDETLIHSISKGPRNTSGHMVEVKLDRQHAILYWVHKRPFCDEFLRKVSRCIPMACIAAWMLNMSNVLGVQVVQRGYIHRLSSGICRPSY